MCTYSRWPHWHPVGVVIDPVDTCWNCRWLRVTTMSTPTLLENFEGFSVILKEQSGEKGTCSSLKIWKPPSLKKNLLVCLVHDFARMQLQTWDFPTLRSTFITKMKKFAKPFVPVHMGPRLNLISKNINGREAFYHCTNDERGHHSWSDQFNNEQKYGGVGGGGDYHANTFSNNLYSGDHQLIRR